MLQVNNLKENQESIIKSLLKRNIDYSNEINKAIELDEQRKKIQKSVVSRTDLLHMKLKLIFVTKEKK